MVWTNFIGSFNVFFTPLTIFNDLNKQPRWFTVFFIITGITIFIGYLSLPFKQEVMFSALSAQLGEARAQETLSNASRFAFLGLLIAPIPLLIKWVIVAALLYYSVILIGSQHIGFKKIFSVVVHSELIFLFMGIVNVIILEINGIDSATSLTDLQTIVGLEYILTNKSQNIPLFTFLSNFNVFTIWYLVVLSLGLSIVSQLSKWKSAIIVSVVWFLGIGFQVGVAYLSKNLQEMMGK